MFCQHRNWQIDIDYDHKVDCNITVESGDGESREDKDEDIEAGKHCSWTNSKKNTGTKDSTNCLKVNNPKEKHGFFACVDTLKSQHIYPFKYSDQAEYFIIAYAAENAVKDRRQDSHIRIHEGESINLMCNFNIQSNLSNQPYVVYWIRASSESSNVTCVYSYEYSNHEPFFDFHCPIGKDFLTRVSNTTSDNPLGDHRFHNLTISNGSHSDSGHYVCALNVIKGKKGFWAVIANITVTVDRQGPSDPNATDGERTTSRITPNTKVTIDKTEQPNQNAIQPPGANLTPLYVVLAIVIIIVFAITIYIRKKGNTAKVVKEKRQDSHIRIHEGESINLMCNFNIQSNLSNQPYVVYWITASSESSNVTCVYSYEYSNHGPFFDFHCPIGKDFLTRISNTTSDNPLGDHRFHNLTISNGSHSDSGHYVCALNVIKGKKGFWAVIANITVTVDRQGASGPRAIQPPGANLTPLYVVLAIVIIIVFAITIYIRKKGNTAKGSPYSVSGRELEPYSVVQLAAPPADSVERDQSELSAEPYSIVMQNSLYEASGPSQGDKDSSKPRTEHLAGNMKQPEGAVDTGAHVYEVIKDTNSTC
ncbi:hypothetical protein JZ751_003664 [Albula glossodonta]|uniref:Ig-like domain-containing protein n=1 Tax=Albula glossodonta TaxID=121402 RepID=A0A8T2MPQ5_9TELE|nr:hypothetical protein JZ751_003664 [Albula glossodonta]